MLSSKFSLRTARELKNQIGILNPIPNRPVVVVVCPPVIIGYVLVYPKARARAVPAKTVSCPKVILTYFELLPSPQHQLAKCSQLFVIRLYPDSPTLDSALSAAA